jgi:hypothetical protein
LNKIEYIKAETDSTILAVQNQAISTNLFKNKNFKEEIDRKTQFVNNMKKLLTT